jgi:hypothetical protein
LFDHLEAAVMAPVVELLSRNNPVFSAFVFYSTILALKMLAMSVLTARQRMRKQVRNVAITSWWMCVLAAS